MTKPKLIGTGIQMGLISDCWRKEALLLRQENRKLRGILGRLVFCEDAEFYPSAIEKASPYCIDFEQWHEDAIKLLTGGKDE